MHLKYNIKEIVVWNGQRLLAKHKMFARPYVRAQAMILRFFDREKKKGNLQLQY